MSEKNPPLSREQRLAAQLRANLQRRKVQARGLHTGESADDRAEAGREGAVALPKAEPSS